MMAFLVDDLLDFAQLNAGKFRKTVKKFELKEAMEEIIDVQKDKASMSGIQLSCEYIPQSAENKKITTLFSKNKKLLISRAAESSEEEDASVDLSFNSSRKPFVPKTPIMVETDRRRLQQVILNIQSNALKFTERTGKVTLYYSIYNLNEKCYLEVQVKDTGVGIQRKDKPKLFKLFGFVQSTEDMNTKGIGLGLVISKKIVESYGGEIGFKSKWKKGSTFGFRIQLENVIDTEAILYEN